jgi:hypothetical protein
MAVAASSRTWRTGVPNWVCNTVERNLERRTGKSGRPFHMVALPLGWTAIGRRHGISVFRAVYTSITCQLVATQLFSCRNLWEIAQWHVIDIDFLFSVLKMNLVELFRIQMCLRSSTRQVTFDLTFDKNKLYQKLFNAFASCDMSNGVWSHFVIGYNLTFLASKLLELKYVILCWWTK